MNVGHRRAPTTLRSVRPGPAYCVCLWRIRIARCATSSAVIAAGTIRMWITKKRVMVSVPGNAPPKTRNATQTPTSGIESTTEYAMRRPVPES